MKKVGQLISHGEIITHNEAILDVIFQDAEASEFFFETCVSTWTANGRKFKIVVISPSSLLLTADILLLYPRKLYWQS